MHQEDELDFEEDELVPQASANIATTADAAHSRTATEPAAIVLETTTAAQPPRPKAHDPALDAQGRKLPPGWVSRLSNTTGELYYRNTVNNTSSWEIPTRDAAEPEGESPPSRPVEAVAPVAAVASVAPAAAQSQQPEAVAAQAASQKIDKPVPTGPRDRSRLAQPHSNGTPTGPRAVGQSASAPSRPAPVNGPARYPPRATNGASGSSPAVTSQASRASNGRQSIPTQPAASSNPTGPRSSRAPPPAQVEPRAIRAPVGGTNAVPLGPRNPRNASTPSTPVSTGTSEIINPKAATREDTQKQAVETNGDRPRESARAVAARHADKDLPPHARTNSGPSANGPRRIPGHSTAVRPERFVQSSGSRQEEQDRRSSDIVNGNASRTTRQDAPRVSPPPSANSAATSRRPRSPSPVGRTGKKVEDLDKSLDDYNRVRDGNTAAASNGRDRPAVRKEERAKSPIDRRRERSNSRERARYADTRETDRRRMLEQEEEKLANQRRLATEKNRERDRFAPVDSTPKPPPTTSYRPAASSSNAVEIRHVRSLRDRSRSPPLAPSPAQKQRMRDEARMQRDREQSTDVRRGGGAGGWDDRRDRDDIRARERDYERERELDRLRELDLVRERERERERLRELELALERERQRTRERERELEMVKERELEMLRERESRARAMDYRMDDRDRDRDGFRNRDRDYRRDSPPPLLRFAPPPLGYPPGSAPRLRPRSRSRSPPPPPHLLRPRRRSASFEPPRRFDDRDRLPPPLYLRVDQAPPASGPPVPLMRIVRDPRDGPPGGRDYSPPPPGPPPGNARLAGARKGARRGRGREQNRERSPIRARSPGRGDRSPARTTAKEASASAPRPGNTEGSPPTAPPSLLSRINGLPERPSLSINGAAKRVRDPDQIIKEAESKKRKGT
ncbi:uncharacterized protein JCM15063_000983 [Sporobolomyces koalae]|uniref:uncharacterized protein n=1 Tax=Sporobolomyces koalae TaxID=500713 RepID=UPI0031749EE4